MTLTTTIDGRPRCDHWTAWRLIGTIRGVRRGTWNEGHQCPNPAKYRVQAADRFGKPDPNKVPSRGEQPCGRHVRPYLMDNGDSVWKPWIVTRLVQ